MALSSFFFIKLVGIVIGIQLRVLEFAIKVKIGEMGRKIATCNISIANKATMVLRTLLLFCIFWPF